jgi:S1-C subfamily serine protease
VSDVRSQVLAVALCAGALGAGLALAVAGISGNLGGKETVVLDRSSGATVTVPDGSTARPLTGNGFDPAAIYAARAKSVVTVYADIPGSGRSQGSGFVVDDEGTVLTSAHVITSAGTTEAVRRADSVVVELFDGERLAAEIVGWDLFSDTGVLRIAQPPVGLTPAPLGDSGAVAVGDPVAAIGSPFGNQGSLAVGVVSAVGRSLPTLTSGYTLTDAIQIDAPINRGNSGGPLLDARGRVIGINAQIRSTSGTAEGVGFAVPVNAARRSLAQLESTGKVVYPYVGVRTEDVTPGLARRFDLGTRRGALVATVEPDSPAERAGIEGGSGTTSYQGLDVSTGGDVIVAIGGEPISGAADVARILTERYLPGDRVGFTVVRGGERLTLQLTLGTRPDRPRD